MAEKLTAESAGRDHNIADIMKLIKDCAASMVDIKARRKELNEEASDIRERLRDSGVQPKAFDFALKLFEMEAEARAEYIDSLRLNMEAMDVGEQGLLFLNGEFPDDDQPDEQEDPEGPNADTGA